MLEKSSSAVSLGSIRSMVGLADRSMEKVAWSMSITDQPWGTSIIGSSSVKSFLSSPKPDGYCWLPSGAKTRTLPPVHSR